MAKFRSWNEELKCFIFFEDGYYSFFENGVEKYFLLGTDFNDLVMRNGNHYQFDWQNAEQSTGLKDKKGKEIFVGDKVIWNDLDYGGEYIVVFDEDAKSFGKKNINGDFIDNFYDYDAEAWNDTIIGNIHEVQE